METGQLTVHADRGTWMTSKPVAMLLADLGVTSNSRPNVSNDNPYSEAQFKTLKHHPTFPARFGCIQDARAFCQTFFGWYNLEHRHAGIGLLTGADVHYGRAKAVTSARAVVLDAAYAAHPERFVGKPPQPPPTATGGVDQQAHRPIGGASAISRLTCLTQVDRLRSARLSTASSWSPLVASKSPHPSGLFRSS